MVTQDGKLMPFGPGVSQELNLKEWRKGVRVQQVAFQLAAVATRQFIDEHGHAVPAHRLFPQLLGYSVKFLQSKLKLQGDRQPVDVALNPYFLRVLDAICHSLTLVVSERSNGELARIARGVAGQRSTAQVSFHTTRQVWGTVIKCHLNLCVADTSQWEQSAAYCLDVHPGVEAWVKNDHQGLFIPYRKAGKAHNYIPDFVVRLVNDRMLIVEVKGQLDDAEIKQVAAERWVKAVNREKDSPRWSYHLLQHPADLMRLIDAATDLAATLPILEMEAT